MKTAIAAISVFIFFASCENTDIIEIEIDFIEHVVVRADLVKDSVFNGVTFTKTLPLEEEYIIEKAELKSVTAYLRKNFAQIIPLHYDSAGVYKPFYKLIIEGKSTYELFAEIDDILIYSITRVPGEPQITRTNSAGYNYLEANVKSHAQEVYGSIWLIKSSSTAVPLIKADDYYSITSASNLNAQFAFTRTTNIPDEFRTSFYSDKFYIQVVSFDKAYREYFKTKNNNQPITNIFAQGGGPINWNIEGENVIGLFIGSAESSIIKVK